MSTDILRIIEGGLANDRRKIINYSTRLAEKARSEGNEQLARCIIERINASTSNSGATSDAIRMIPLDNDSRMQIVEVVPENKTRTTIILDDFVDKQIQEFINIVKHSAEIEMAGLSVNKTLLLYGAPGCGKTSIAHYISEQTNLPLVVARLDGLVSSLLGNTAKNIRKIFNYAASLPCILFLDEFDAIAKARNDNHELGELKRVINSLLQNIDELPSSCILIAATNHPELLDKAVWRRFLTRIEVGMPDATNRMKILKSHLENYDNSFCDDVVKMKIICDLMAKMSPSDISTVLTKLKLKGIITGNKQIEYEDILSEIFGFEGKQESQEAFMKYLHQYGVTQATIAKMLNLSLRQVRNVLVENK